MGARTVAGSFGSATTIGDPVRRAPPELVIVQTCFVVNAGRAETLDGDRVQRGVAATVRGSAHALASMMRFIGVWAARRKWRNPASSKMARSFASPAWAPRAAPTSCDSELGVQTHDEAT